MKDIIRLCGRVFEVDCELEVDLAEAGHSDRLVDTVDYARVFAVIKEAVEGKAYSLIERLAQHLADIVLDTFPVYRVTLRVRKMNPPIVGQIKYIEVEITRYQSDTDKLIDKDKGH
jgi:dihydroneopterin aldolase